MAATALLQADAVRMSSFTCTTPLVEFAGVVEGVAAQAAIDLEILLVDIEGDTGMVASFGATPKNMILPVGITYWKVDSITFGTGCICYQVEPEGATCLSLASWSGPARTVWRAPNCRASSSRRSSKSTTVTALVPPRARSWVCSRPIGPAPNTSA